jgi:hypothetical protein
MGSYRAKNASITELLKAHARGVLPGMLKVDQGNREAILRTLNNWGWGDDLELYLPFDETSGQTAFDLSGNANTGTATGTTIVDGVFGKARNFDRPSTDCVDCGAQASLIPANISMECWFKPSALADMGIVTNKMGANYGTNLVVRANGQIQILVGNGSSYVYITASVTASIGTWCYVASTYKAAETRHKLYVDGKFENTDTFTLNYGTPTPKTVVGVFYTNLWGPFAGIIDEVRVYSRVLSAEEIYLHYLAGALKLGLI